MPGCIGQAFLQDAVQGRFYGAGEPSASEPRGVEPHWDSVNAGEGQRVMSQALTNAHSVLNKTFTAGVYVVKVNEVSHKVIVK